MFRDSGEVADYIRGNSNGGGGGPIRHLLFVYGNYMAGFKDNSVLLSSCDCDLLGTGGNNEFVTGLRYRMIHVGTSPAILKAPSTIPQRPSAQARMRSMYRPVVGEVYSVTKETLSFIDAQSEGRNEHLFKRELIPIRSLASARKSNGKGYAWAYILQNPMQYLGYNETLISDEECFSWHHHCYHRRIKTG